MTDPVLSTLENSILTLTLNRPKRLNGFTDELAQQLHDHIVAAGSDAEIRVIVIGAVGRVFSVGMDLDDLLAGGFSNAQIGQILDDLYNPLVRAMSQCPKPIVCAVNGVVAGGAVSLVLGCDIIVARSDARFVSAFSRIGLMPDCGGSWLFPRSFGLHRAKAFAMLEHEIPAREAYALGVIARLAEKEDFGQIVTNTAHELATASPHALGLIKRSFNDSLTGDLHTRLQQERDWQECLSNEDDFREGVTAFREKRKPVF